MITKSLIERALDLLAITSNDATRYALSHVQITSTPNKDDKALSTVVMVATNGHMLCERTFVGKFPGGVYAIHFDQLRAIKSFLKELPKHCDEIEATIQENGALLLGLINHGSTVTLPKIDFDYPDYQHVIPKAIQNRVAITVNADYLIALAKVLTDGEKRRQPHITIEFDALNPRSAMLVHGATGLPHTAVVMPVRDPKSQGIADAMGERLNPKPVSVKKGKAA